MKCSICHKDYTGLVSDSSLSPCCFSSLVAPLVPLQTFTLASEIPTFELFTTTDEFCDICHSKLKTNRIYFNNQKLCSKCYSIRPNVQKKHKCSKCGFEE